MALQFTFTNEQEDFRGILRRFLGARSPSTEVRKLMETEAGYDRSAWTKLGRSPPGWKEGPGSNVNTTPVKA